MNSLLNKINLNEGRYFLKLYIRWIFVLLSLTQCGSKSELDIYKKDGSLKPTQRPYSIKDRVYYPQENYEYNVQGIASWYGPGFHGRTTSTGDIFDENRLTAAHNTLPLPCVVRVTNLENKRVIILEVNDRGPFSHERIIDVSRRAAQLLGFLNKGITQVRVECLTEESRLLNKRYPAERAQRVQESRQRKKVKKKETRIVKKQKPHLEIDQKFVRLLKKQGVPSLSPLPSLKLSKSTLNHSTLGKSVSNKLTENSSFHKESLKSSLLKEKGKKIHSFTTPSIRLNKEFKLPGEHFIVSLGKYPNAQKAKKIAKNFVKIAPLKILKSKQGYEIQLGPLKTIKEAEIMIKQLSKIHKQPAKILKLKN